MQLVDGPFKYFAGSWNFIPLGDNGCKVDFILHYKFSNFFIEKIIGPVFSFISKNIVDCFIKEAHKLYAKPGYTLNMDFINIEVAYATPDKQIIISISVPSNTPVLEAIVLSNIAKYFLDNQLDKINVNSPIGIFGKKINVENYKLRNKDRIEIYRPLHKTPNQRRLERANQQ